MDFAHSVKVKSLLGTLAQFMEEEIYPRENAFYEWTGDSAHLWQPWPEMEGLKRRARALGLWNLFLPPEYGEFSPGLTTLEYAPLAEIMGRSVWASEVFNCSAPDTGNMEILAKYGTPKQKTRWLRPLIDGEFRSAYLMTEPAVASSDATNVSTQIRRDGGDYVISGRKWWISGILDPRCQVLLVMGKTDPDAPRHLQQSTIIVPRNTPGIEVVRSQTMFGDHRSPGGEAEVLLDDVRVPAEHLILGEGRGFEIAQGRLGPGRIHHCMRSIGQAQRALEIMADRVSERIAFGRPLADQGSIQQDIARSFCEIEQARLLTLKAAAAIDERGGKSARDLIAAIKIVAPKMATRVIDRAIQAHGGMGLSADVPLVWLYTQNRALRIADGPDEVHMAQLGKAKIAEYAARKSR